jgi:hypothetical protein
MTVEEIDAGNDWPSPKHSLDLEIQGDSSDN